MLIVPWIVRHTSMSGLFWAKPLVWPLLYFHTQSTTIPSHGDVEWTFLWAFRHSETRANLGSLSLSRSLSVSTAHHGGQSAGSGSFRRVRRACIWASTVSGLGINKKCRIPIEANHRIIKWYFHAFHPMVSLRYISASIYSTPPSSQTLPSKFQESTNGIYIRSSGSLPSRCAGM